jgi:hypothetical protein
VLHRDAILRHLRLRCLAHLLLTHRRLEAIGAKATQANNQVEIPPMSQRPAALRAEVASDQIRDSCEERSMKGCDKSSAITCWRRNGRSV